MKCRSDRGGPKTGVSGTKFSRRLRASQSNNSDVSCVVSCVVSPDTETEQAGVKESSKRVFDSGKGPGGLARAGRGVSG